MSTERPPLSRPDRCVIVRLPADRPEAIPENADLAAEFARGRKTVAMWRADDPAGMPRVVLVLGPVPVSFPNSIGALPVRHTRISPLAASTVAVLCAGSALFGAFAAVVLYGWLVA
jgi:hypothetical protein